MKLSRAYIEYLKDECKILQRLLNERDEIINNLERDNKELRQACNEYDNLMRECIFDQ